MNKHLLSTIGLGLTLSLMLTGCQAATNVEQAPLTQEVKTNIPNVPYTRGPTTPPGVKGPTMAVPNSDGVVEGGQTQAMTEKENTKFTLNSK